MDDVLVKRVKLPVALLAIVFVLCLTAAKITS